MKTDIQVQADHALDAIDKFASETRWLFLQMREADPIKDRRVELPKETWRKRERLNK